MGAEDEKKFLVSAVEVMGYLQGSVDGGICSSSIREAVEYGHHYGRSQGATEVAAKLRPVLDGQLCCVVLGFEAGHHGSPRGGGGGTDYGIFSSLLKGFRVGLIGAQ
ncbi:hypothetical protein V5799_010188 [Amblyomma americanum]|uniref:Uncharacterized protein n=1 Tax=Amblyomma americanum TaxID=6943 RepID=A0AAQ4F8N6_AMBAM